MDVAAREIQGSPLTPTVLGPSRHRLRVSDLWTTRAVARMIASRDIRAKYKQAALGPLWLLIAPLGMLFAVTIAFSGVTNVQTYGIPYVLFALTGLTVWTYIQLSLTLGTGALVANATLIRRSPMPRLAFVTGSMLGNLPPFSMMLTLTLLGTVFLYHVSLQILLLPLLMAWLFLFTLGIMLVMSPIAARYRDAASIMPLIIQGGMFVTPVGYGLAGAPSSIHAFLVVNPASGLIEAWRWAVLDLPHPQLSAIAAAAGWTVLLLGAGWRIFGRMEVDIADFV